MEVAAAYGLDGIFTPTNFFNYFDIEVFGALVQATQTDVFEERYALYEMVMMKFTQDIPVYYSGHTATMLAVTSGVEGINGWVLPDGTFGGQGWSEPQLGQAFLTN